MAWDRVTCWNMKVGRDNETVMDQLGQLIQDTSPDIVVLQEAEKYVGSIKKRFGSNNGGKWFVYAHDDWDESRMNIVMVWAKGREWQTYGEGWGTLRYKTKWTGPQGGTHNGRTWTWVVVNGVIVMSLHRCTDGNGQNKAAFQDEYDVLTKFIRNHSKPVLILGDHNCGHGKTFKGASKLIAQDTGSWLEWDADEPGIDYAIRKGLDGNVKRRNKTYGSDHEPVVFTT